jgi:guanylate kinase
VFAKNTLGYMLRFFITLILSFLPFTYTSCQELNSPIIILLKGTCSSGKSTLIQSIADSDMNIEIVDEDTYVHDGYLSAIQTRFPLEYNAIAEAIDYDNMYLSLRSNDMIYNSHSSYPERCIAEKYILDLRQELNKPEYLNWKNSVSENITDTCLDAMKNALEHGKSVLLDAWYISGNRIRGLFPNNTIIKILLYCELQEGYRRLMERNLKCQTTRNIREKRSAAQLIGSFNLLYKVSKTPLQPIHKFNFETFNNLMAEIEETLPVTTTLAQVFSFKECSKSEFRGLQLNFLKDFEHNNCYITPKENHDLIIDNTYLKKGDAFFHLKTFLDQL